MKKITIDRLISNAVFVGMLMGMLPINLSLSGQTQSAKELKTLKMEIDQEITKIKTTVNRLKAARIAAPIILAGAGAAVLIGIAVFFIIPSIGLVIAIRLLRTKTFKSYNDMLNKIKFFVPFWIFKRMKDETVGDDTFQKFQILTKNNRIKDILLPELNRLTALGSVGAISAFLFGLITIGVSIGSIFGLSAWLVSEASKGVEKIERIKRKYPGILTAKQKRVVAQFKNLLKDTAVQDIIKNLRLEEVLLSIANVAMQEHRGLVKKLGGIQSARKIFMKYIKLKYQEELFEKSLVAAGAVKVPLTKRQANKIKNKIKKLEKNHPELKTVLNKAVKAYTTKVNEILEELKEEMLKAAQEKEAKKKQIVMPPIVPLL